MDADSKKTGQVSAPGHTVPNESHYHSKKDRVFVRAIQGSYNLTTELARLRAMPRVRKGTEISFNDGPQAFSRHLFRISKNIFFYVAAQVTNSFARL